MNTVLLLLACATSTFQAGHELMRLPLAKDLACKVALARDGSSFIVCQGGKASLYVPPNHKPAWVYPGLDAAFLRDGKTVAVLAPGAVVLRSLQKGTATAKLVTHSKMDILSEAPDGATLVTGYGGRGGIGCWDVKSRRLSWHVPMFGADRRWDAFVVAVPGGGAAVVTNEWSNGEPPLHYWTAQRLDDHGRSVALHHSSSVAESVSALCATADSLYAITEQSGLEELKQPSLDEVGLLCPNGIIYSPGLWLTSRGIAALCSTDLVFFAADGKVEKRIALNRRKIREKLSAQERAGLASHFPNGIESTEWSEEVLVGGISADATLYIVNDGGSLSVRRIVWK